jgi:hypothetical protein
MEESITRQEAMGEGGRMRTGSSTLQSIIPAKAITFMKLLTAQSFLGLQILSYSHILRNSFVRNKFHGTTFIKRKVNVYLPSLMMKVPDHVYVLG